jgi:hypothetical protein
MARITAHEFAPTRYSLPGVSGEAVEHAALLRTGIKVISRRRESLTLTFFHYRVGIDLGMDLPP